MQEQGRKKYDTGKSLGMIPRKKYISKFCVFWKRENIMEIVYELKPQVIILIRGLILSEE